MESAAIKLHSKQLEEEHKMKELVNSYLALYLDNPRDATLMKQNFVSNFTKQLGIKKSWERESNSHALK